MALRLRSAGVDVDVSGWDKSSDHTPVWIELDLIMTASRLIDTHLSRARSFDQ